MKKIFQMIPEYDATGWVVAAPDDNFFVGLDLAMQSHLPKPEYQEWAAEAAAWEVAP